MKILGGYEQPTAGAIVLDDQPRTFRTSREAEAAGIVLIHQEFNLAEDLTIAENIFLGHELRRGWWLDTGARGAAAARKL
jgi:ribose transport system ATP-binding protein